MLMQNSRRNYKIKIYFTKKEKNLDWEEVEVYIVVLISYREGGKKYNLWTLFIFPYILSSVSFLNLCYCYQSFFITS